MKDSHLILVVVVVVAISTIILIVWEAADPMFVKTLNTAQTVTVTDEIVSQLLIHIIIMYIYFTNLIGHMDGYRSRITHVWYSLTNLTMCLL